MALTFTSLTFDQASYAPGQAITLTVDYTSTDEAPASSVTNAVTVALADAASGSVTQSQDFTVSTPANEAEPVTVSATDDRSTPGTWTLVSSALTGTAPPFSGTAVLTSAA